jgi:NAD(P)-dependent dehydrogenase (short-subunit alcohol dehydrogenase family)
VAVTGRDQVAGTDVVEKISAAGGEAIFVRADMGVESDVEGLVAEALRRFGGVDVLVNNAAPVSDIGAGGDAPVSELSTAAFEYMLKVCLYGPFWACRAVIPSLRERGGGSIINISSLVSQNGQPSMPAYCSSKAGLNGLTRQMANE